MLKNYGLFKSNAFLKIMKCAFPYFCPTSTSNVPAILGPVFLVRFSTVSKVKAELSLPLSARLSHFISTFITGLSQLSSAYSLLTMVNKTKKTALIFLDCPIVMYNILYGLHFCPGHPRSLCVRMRACVCVRVCVVTQLEGSHMCTIESGLVWLVPIFLTGRALHGGGCYGGMVSLSLPQGSSVPHVILRVHQRILCRKIHLYTSSISRNPC